MLVRFNFSITLFKKFILLFRESKRVTLRLGKTIFKTSPGKPAPVPISISVSFLVKSITFIMVRES